MIHALVDDKIVLLVYLLLPKKSKRVYVKAVKLLAEKTEDLRLDVSSPTFHSDYEKVVIKAGIIIFPGARHIGCYFPIAQAVWRHAQGLGLKVVYSSSHNSVRFYSQCLALVFLPIRYVLFGRYGLRASSPSVPRIEEFNDYLEGAYLFS
ncbi:hypothetical protein QYM36_007977 [Artemia franciscana]|uniref:Uncharacterized protein n=1 Tax=Artemia franciscana TaxID=6661 RepID=A0AA88IFE6_ARTSF|nr:hypothetical protein QYM36_007977 [Artemia franciscana]